MFIYLGCFVLSVGLLFLSERIKTSTRGIKIILIVVSLLIPAILAGLRASSVGTDVTVYGISYYTRAIQANGLIDFFKIQTSYAAVDYGFNFITYICSLVSKDYHFGLFVYQLIALIFIYLGLFRFKKIFGTKVYVVLLLYYFCLYNNSLNALRQMMAVAIIFYGTSFLFERKYKLFVLWFIIAFTMHSSAIVALLLLPLYLLAKEGGQVNYRKQTIRSVILIILFVVVLMGSGYLINFLMRVGILRENYSNYLAGGRYADSGAGLSIFVLAVQAFYLVALIFLKKRMDGKGKEPLVFIFVSLVVLFATCFGPLIATYISRLSYYFIPIQMVGLVNTGGCFRRKNHSDFIWLSIIVLVTFAYWMRSSIILNYAVTVPYLFYWQ